jgi:oxygen-independent coproporphyrinogen-3 oxidase
MTSPRHSETAGLYVHLPFCRKKCLYCNFLTAPLSRLVDPYLAAVQREARNAAAAAGDAWPEFDTVYLGGGTPSLLPPDRIAALLAALRETFPVSPAAEITLESNPEDVTATAAAAWRAAGVNRVTVGVQTTHAPTLERMQRDGGPAAVRAAVAVLREAGIDNVALDLIAGLPGDAAVHWEESLRFALALAPPHLSLYLLDVEEHSVLARRAAGGSWALAADDDLADFYLAAVDTLESVGLCQYEISNFARPGHESRHNLKYWRLAPYLGLGAGAHSFTGRRRFWNLASLKAYLTAVQDGRSPVAGGEPEDPAERAREFLMLAMRQRAGFSPAAFAGRFGGPPPAHWRERAKIFIEDGLVLDDNGALRLTPRGMLLSNEIFQTLCAPDPPAPFPEFPAPLAPS